MPLNTSNLILKVGTVSGSKMRPGGTFMSAALSCLNWSQCSSKLAVLSKGFIPPGEDHSAG